MSDITVKCRLEGAAEAPKYATTGAAGCDVCSGVDIVLPPRDHRLVRTGLFLEVPDGFEGRLVPRSGLAMKHGITLMNCVGIIDSDYRGEVGALLWNTSDVAYEVKKGDRIAQLIIAPVVRAHFEVVDELTDTSRGSGGFGSTGR